MSPRTESTPAHDACSPLLNRLAPNPELLWQEVEPQIANKNTGVLVIDDSTLEHGKDAVRPVPVELRHAVEHERYGNSE